MTEYVMKYDGWAEGMSIDAYLKVRDAMHARKRERIVRCRDCGYIVRPIGSDGKERTYCTHFVHRMHDLDGFCAWGERKKDE